MSTTSPIIRLSFFHSLDDCVPINILNL